MDAPTGATDTTIAAATETSFAALLRRRAEEQALDEREFTLVPPSDDTPLTATVHAKRSVDSKTINRKWKSEGEFLTTICSKVTLTDDEGNSKDVTWGEVHQLMGLPASITISQVPSSMTGGNDVLLSAVSQEILEWLTAAHERTVSDLGR